MNRPSRRALLTVTALVCLAGTMPSLAATVHLSGPVGADVRLDGHRLGLLPMASLDLPLGVYEIECRARGYENLSQSLVITDNDVTLHVRLRPNQIRRSRAIEGSLLYAGVGQRYMGARWRGWLYTVGETVGLLTALSGEIDRQNCKDEYTNAIRQYRQAVSPATIEKWHDKAEEAYADVADAEDVRNMGLMIAAGTWAVSLLDAWLLFPSVDVGPGPVPCTTAATDTPAGRSLHAAVSIGF